MIKPIYIFTGFLEAGKTSAIIESMCDPYFNDGTKSLLIVLEQGAIEYDDEFLKHTNSQIVYLDYPDLNLEKMQELENNYDFSRIIIEFNGMENLIEFVEKGFIKNWELAEIMCFINTENFNIYLNNYKQKVYNNIKLANVVIFNRYKDQNRTFLRSNLKVINPKVTIIYENTNKEILTDSASDIFNLEQKEIKINDDDYGLWYVDAIDDPKKYEGKCLILKMKLLNDLKKFPNALVMGREAMVCCMADIAPVGIACLGIDKKQIEANKYYLIKGVIHLLKDNQNQQTCVLYVDEVNESTKPENELIQFV